MSDQPPHTDDKPAPPAKAAETEKKSRGRFSAFLARFLPTTRTRRWIGYAAALLVLTYGGFLGSRQRTGWGLEIDIAIGVGVTLAMVLLAPLALSLIMAILRLIPRYVGWFGLGAFLAFFLLLDMSGISDEQGLMVAAGGVLLVGMTVGTLAVMTGGATGMFRRTVLVGGSLTLIAFGSGYLLRDLERLSDEMLLPFGVGWALFIALTLGTLAAFTNDEFRKRGFVKKTLIGGSYLVGLAAISTSVLWVGENRWLTEEASLDHLVDVEAVLAAERTPAPLDAENPSLTGDFPVLTLTYGSGHDRQRPELFGEGVTLVTEPVNGKPFTSIPDGWKGDMRKNFWGFGIDKLPVQGQVWYPEGAGPFPLALIVHGNHNMAEYSDPGYQYLGELMASRGFIFVTVDENFLNGASGRFFAGANRENDARGWLLLKHLEVWRQWNETDGHQFQGLVDMDNIALLGHSRGGEAVQHAAVFNRLDRYPDDASVEFDFGFSLKGILSIAPVDTQYRPADRDAVMHDVSFFTIHGSHDADVTRFHGDRMFRRLRFTQPGDFFKSTLYVYRANHGQFNTVWGPTDTGAPRAWFLNTASLLEGEDQRMVAKIYISAFLEATLRGRREYLPMFRDHRVVRHWLPDILLVNRFEDPSFRLITDYEEDVDVTTASIDGGRLSGENLVVWREGDIKFRGGGNRDDHGVFLGWNIEEQEKLSVQAMEASFETETDPAAEPATEPSDPQPLPPATYTISLPENLPQDWQLGPNSLLVLNVAQSTDSPKPKDYSIDEENDEEDPGEEQEGTPTEPNASETGEEEGQGNADTEEGEEDSEEDEEDDLGPLDFTVELVTRRGIVAGVQVSRFGNIPPPLKAQVLRGNIGGEPSSEPVLQTIEIPLSAFIEAESNFVPVDLSEIRLVFDQEDKGVVILDRVGFAQG